MQKCNCFFKPEKTWNENLCEVESAEVKLTNSVLASSWPIPWQNDSTATPNQSGVPEPMLRSSLNLRAVSTSSLDWWFGVGGNSLFLYYFVPLFWSVEKKIEKRLNNSSMQSASIDLTLVPGPKAPHLPLPQDKWKPNGCTNPAEIRLMKKDANTHVHVKRANKKMSSQTRDITVSKHAILTKAYAAQWQYAAQYCLSKQKYVKTICLHVPEHRPEIR